MRKHPIYALIFIWLCDLIALSLITNSIYNLSLGTWLNSWFDFGVWTILLCIARLGIIELIDLKVGLGWATAIELATAQILPFPLFCLSVIISFIAIVIRRIIKKHPEPFIGPDFNAANLTFAGALSDTTRNIIKGLLHNTPHMFTFSLMISAIVFSCVQVLLLTTLLSIDFKRPWNKVGSLDTDVLLSEATMISVGVIVSSIYMLDPYLFILTLMPMIFLQKVLKNFNDAKLAYLDAKTGMYNYRYFDTNLNEEFRKSSQTDNPLALIFADMDHLRDVNNIYGHMVGDIALTHVAKAFKEIEDCDAIAARFGGEEFVMLIPGYTTAQGVQVAERIRRKVEEASIPLDSGQTLKITVSLGVASFPADASTAKELIEAADVAVYEAKNTGRNRVCVFEKGKTKE